MNPAIQCIILLACMVIYTSADAFHCTCPKTSKGVKPSLIVDVKEYKPRPYCNKHEVIVTLKDNRSMCLNPQGKFTEAVRRTIAMMKEKHAKMKLTTQQPEQSNGPSRPSVNAYKMKEKHAEKMTSAQSTTTTTTTTSTATTTTSVNPTSQQEVTFH